MVAEGQGVPPDALEAAGLFRRAFPRLETACASGMAQVCVLVGSMVDKGQGAPADPARALYLYRRACEGGVAGGCFAAGTKLESADPAGAAILYRRACDGRSAAGCSALGVLLARGKGGVPADPEQARALQKRACDAGFAPACRRLAEPSSPPSIDPASPPPP